MPVRHHAGAQLVNPWAQGQLDALCGPYSVINGLCILHAPTKPLSRRVCNTLFREAVEAACRKQKGAVSVYDGMTVAGQLKVAKTIFRSRALRDRAPAVLREAAPRVRRHADLDRVWEGCLRRGDVLLVNFRGRIQHHSVIYGLTDERIWLFDSLGMRFVRRTTLRVAETPRGALILKSLVPMGLVEPGADAQKPADGERHHLTGNTNTLNK